MKTFPGKYALGWAIVLLLSLTTAVASYSAAADRGDIPVRSNGSRIEVCRKGMLEAGYTTPDYIKSRIVSRPFFEKDVSVCSFRYEKDGEFTKWQSVKVGSLHSSQLMALAQGFFGLTLVSIIPVIVFLVLKLFRISPPMNLNVSLSGLFLLCGIALGIYYMA